MRTILPQRAGDGSYTQIAQACGLITTLIGAAGLAGWLFNISTLKSILPHLASMKANTASGLVLAGAALILAAPEHPALWRRRASFVCAALVTLVGLLTLAEYFLSVNLGIDQILFTEPPGALMTSSPGRMGANTALCFAAAGGALLLLNTASRKLGHFAEAMTLTTLWLALAGLMGYAYDVVYLTRIASATQMALHTASAFAVLCMGLIAARRCSAFAGMLLSATPGGLLLRRFFPQASLALMTLAWLRLKGERAGWYDTAFGVGLLVTAGILFFGVLTWRAARALNALDAERSRAEEVSRYQLNLTRAITENARLCLLMMDTEGRVTFANPAAERITGFKPEELIGQSLHYKIHHTRPDGTRFPIRECPLVRALPSQDPIIGYEDMFVHKDGRFYPVRCNARPIIKEGKVVAAVVEVQDITEEKRLLEVERKAREQAEAANRLKDEFLAMVSHELRTPLNAILGWAAMLESNRLRPAKAAEAVEVIVRSARSQNRLIGDLLDVSRIVTGNLEVKLQPVMLSEVIRNAVADVMPAADAKSISLQVALAPQSCPVFGDPDRLQQVIWNLVSNAVKFTPRGGSVEVRLECGASDAEIKVSDTGEGITPEFLPHVFDRFRQADASIQRRHKGLGLGLAIVRHLVELHGGEVQAESAGPGRGATFTVRIPLAKGAAAGSGTERGSGAGMYPQRASAERAIRLDKIKALVVDDEADARVVLMELLEARGAQVRTAGDMSEALRIVFEWEPDVLVSDLAMPNGSGYDLIREIRSRSNSGKRLPAVAVTAHARAEDREQAFSSGFDGFVDKPVDPETLLNAITDVTTPGDTA